MRKFLRFFGLVSISDYEEVVRERDIGRYFISEGINLANDRGDFVIASDDTCITNILLNKGQRLLVAPGCRFINIENIRSLS